MLSQQNASVQPERQLVNVKNMHAIIIKINEPKLTHILEEYICLFVVYMFCTYETVRLLFGTLPVVVF